MVSMLATIFLAQRLGCRDDMTSGHAVSHVAARMLNAAYVRPSMSSRQSRSMVKGVRKSTTVACQAQSTAVSGNRGNSNAAAAQMDLGRHFYLNKVLEQYAGKPATRMTLRQLVFFGKTLGRDREKILKSANYVRQELAVRIAHRIRDLQALPFVVMTNAHLEEVYEKYWNAFETFRRIPMIRTMEDNENFCATLKRLLDDHLTIIPSLTIGIVESSQHLPAEQLDGFMERMLRSRISRRVLAEQHIALSDALDDPFHFFNDSTPSANAQSDPLHDGDGDHVGIIYTSLKVSNIIAKVVRLLTNIFQDEVRAGVRTGDAAVIPDVVIDGALETRFAYIPEHLEYIFFELLKNSMMAVMRQPLSARDPVTIRATIVEGPPDEDLIVRVSDCGGGLPDSLTRIHSSQHVRREHRRKQSRLIGRKRREAMEDEAQTIHNNASQQGPSSTASFNTRRPLSASSAESQADWQVTMDSTLSDDSSTSFMAALSEGEDALHAQQQHSADDIALSSAKHAVVDHGRTMATGTTSAPGASASRAGGASNDPLITAVASFSNVRRRLELEEEVLRRAKQKLEAEKTSANLREQQPEQESGQSGFHAGAESPGREKEALQAGLRALGMEQSGERTSGIDSLAKLEALRSVGRFKGTVAEQLASHDAQQRQNGKDNGGSTSSTSTLDSRIKNAAALHALSGDLRGSFSRSETGLGLPMTKIYTDFFGGSLSLRSLDGHGMDVYVRLPKLGTNKEAIEEIVL